MFVFWDIKTNFAPQNPKKLHFWNSLFFNLIKFQSIETLK